MDNINNVLVIKLSSIGDIIHTVPAVNSIKKSYPSVNIDWVVDDRCADILKIVPNLRRNLVFNRKKWSRARTLAQGSEVVKEHSVFVRTLREAEYDYILDFQGLAVSAYVSILSRGKKRLGVANLRELSWLVSQRVSKDGPAVHAVERGLALARKIGADVSKPGYDLRVIAEDNEWVTCVLNKKGVKPGQKNIGIILGAGVPQKQWAVNKIVETAKVLIQKYNVILLGDKNQAGNEQVLLRECPEVVSTVGLTGLTQFAAVLSRCNVVIGSDTAAVHIAMGYNIPTIGLYGPSNPLKTGLYGDGKKSVIYNKMKCSPCGIRPNCKNNVCMDKISPGEVVEEVEKMFAGVLK